MKAFVVARYGKKERLSLAEVAQPTVGDNDVLVRMHAAGVNPLDLKIRDGAFKLFLPYRLPVILGHEFAGVVERVGRLVQQFKLGDEVYARPADLHIGGFAELIAVNEDVLAIKPSNLSMEEAASIPLVGLTAWQALVVKAKLQPGQKVFIQAGSGGVGTFAIQLAKHLGATVATTTSTGNVGWVKGLGADIVIDYTREDFEHHLRDYDVVLNTQDSKTLAKSLRVLKKGGQVISISGPPDLEFARAIKAPWLVKQVMRVLSLGIRRQAKRHGVDFSFLFMQPNASQLRDITTLLESGVVRPVVDKLFPFVATNEAVQYVESGRAKGKVVVQASLASTR